MRRQLCLAIVAVALLGGCSSGSNGSTASTGGATTTGGGATSGAAKPSAGTTGVAAANSGCSGGLTGSEPGVVRITCTGPAEIRISVGTVTKDFHGGQCQSAGGVWSAAVGVIIDRTGVTGKYTGPPVDNVTINNTSTAGKATIQGVFGNKLFFALGDAKLTLSVDKKTAHVVGSSDRRSDEPNAKIVIDVTC